MAKTTRGANSPNEQEQSGDNDQLKAVRKSDLPNIIYFDDKENDVERKEFSRDHAISLVALQHEKGYKNWTISPGQNLDVKDGKIVGAGTSGTAEE